MHSNRDGCGHLHTQGLCQHTVVCRVGSRSCMEVLRCPLCVYASQAGVVGGVLLCVQGHGMLLSATTDPLPPGLPGAVLGAI